jgi:hypothetical protein
VLVRVKTSTSHFVPVRKITSGNFVEVTVFYRNFAFAGESIIPGRAAASSTVAFFYFLLHLLKFHHS